MSFRDKFDCPQAVAAQVKEIIVPADGRIIQCFLHKGGKTLFYLAYWRYIFHRAGNVIQIYIRQGLAVHFPTAGERHCF